MTETPRVRWLGVTVAGVLIWLVGYPLVLNALEGFRSSEDGSFTLRFFFDFLARSDEWRALWRSTWIALASVLLAAVFGIPLAFVFERTEFPGRRILGALLALPVALPPLVGVIAFLFLWGESGIVARSLRSLGLDVSWRFTGALAILVVHAYSMYVYFYLFTRAALKKIDVAMIEAAASLGASRWRTLRTVILPLLRPAFAGASLLVFMTALASFSAPFIFGGGFRVMTTQIVSSKLNGQLEMARVETVMLMLLAAVGLWAFSKIDRGDALTGGERGTAPDRVVIRGAARTWAALLGWGLALFLLMPHFTLILISFVPPNTWTTEALPPQLGATNYETLFAETERLRPALNSLWMASVATIGALLLGFGAAHLSRRGVGLLPWLLRSLVVFPWAIPGTVFAIALASAFSVNQPWFGRFVLVGTAIILPLAYLVRSLPLTGRAALAGLRQLDPRLEEAAESLGAGPVRVLLRVTLPMLGPALAAGASLAFVTALGDFVASIVLYTFETRPISIEILSSLRQQETGVAAAYGVLLMLVSAAAFLLWGRDAPNA